MIVGTAQQTNATAANHVNSFQFFLSLLSTASIVTLVFIFPKDPHMLVLKEAGQDLGHDHDSCESERT